VPTDLKVAAAQRAHLVLAFRRLEKQLAGGRWLTPRNQYRQETITLTDKPGGHRFGQLVSYIAASAPLHAIDSARYLGRALYCQSVNDVHSARHFAYYAELRAAMSILASAGVGVFNNHHYAVVRLAKADRTSKVGTHPYVWSALTEWSGTTGAADLVSRVITRNGKTLDQLLRSAFPAISLQPLVANWFQTWGLDLSVLAAEKVRRNESSYRPSALLAASSQSPREATSALEDFWLAFEPTGSGKFEKLDLELLRLAFEQQASAVGVRRNTIRFRQVARTVATEATVSNAETELLTRFLSRAPDASPNTLRIVEAARRAPAVREVAQFPMICRAATLLRMALGSVRLLITDSGFSESVFRQWLQAFALQCAVTPGAFTSDERLGLWEDVEEVLNALAAGQRDFSSFSEIVETRSREIVILSECERIAILTLLT
jgi:hypothetical protein